MKKPAVKAKKKVAIKKKAAPASRGLSEAQFKKIALAFPGAIEGFSYGAPAILIVKKFFTRLRHEDNSLVLFVGSIDERDMLIEAEPSLFHITEHYRNYPTVLARLERLDAETLKGMLERRWQKICPKKLMKMGDAR
jgi:hypothetical protein